MQVRWREVGQVWCKRPVEKGTCDGNEDVQSVGLKLGEAPSEKKSEDD